VAGVRSMATQGGTRNEKLRNVAIIAHVDHGKTSLVDKLLTQSGTTTARDGDRVMACPPPPPRKQERQAGGGHHMVEGNGWLAGWLDSCNISAIYN